MINLLEQCRHFKKMLLQLKQGLLQQQNREMENRLDPNDKNRTDPNDTVIEMLVESRRTNDPIDTPLEVKAQQKNESEQNNQNDPSPKM